MKTISFENLFLLAGPCAIEEEGLSFEIAGRIKEITEKLKIPFVFKGSYRKANRTKLNSFTGIGDEKALEILRKIGQELNIPTITDIHESHEAAIAAQYVDMLQIPAFLCRQTDLLTAAAATGLPVNVKKGQFMAGSSMGFAVEKIKDTNPKATVLLTERGNSFGYGELIVDYRNIPTMQSFGVPVILDCTHSLQQPNQASGVTGGQPAMIEAIAKAGVAVGVNGIFIETHPNPKIALSDGANMLALHHLEGLLEKLLRIREAV